MRSNEERSLMEALRAVRLEKRKRSKAKAQRRYHDKAFRTISCKVKKAEADEFAALCAVENISKHEALKTYVHRAIEQRELFFW